MRRTLILATAAVAAIGLGDGVATAQEALYGKQPPKGSAYVRIVNALGAAVEAHPDFMPTDALGVAGENRVGPYHVVENVAGRALVVDLKAGGHSGHAVLHAEPGGFLTIVIQQTPDGGLTATPYVDPSEFNQNRTRLSFYNATPNCGAGGLVLDPGGQAVFQGVAPGTTKSRSVNPVNAQVRAVCADETAVPLTLAGLEAGGMVSVWLMAPDGKPTGFITHDVALPYRP